MVSFISAIPSNGASSQRIVLRRVVLPAQFAQIIQILSLLYTSICSGRVTIG